MEGPAVVIGYLKSRNRLLALGALLVLSFAAAGRNVAQEEGAGRQAWPKEFEASGSKVTIYEPLVESLKGNKLSTRAALSVIPEGSTEPVYGAIWLESTLRTSVDGKTSRPENLRAVELRLPSSDGNGFPGLREAVAAQISRWNLVYDMDALLADLRQLEERKASAQSLKAEVPEINFRSHPAVMVSIDGDPEWRAIPNNRMKRLANSAFFIVEEADAGKCYLRIEPFWWTSASALGPWQAAEDVPEAVENLWKDEPRPRIADEDNREEIARRPEVLVSTRPAELVWTDGLAQYAAIPGTDLLYVKNTSSDVFLEISTQMSYVLLSGRWYRTISTRVAWEFVPSDKLPADFARIPLGSEKQHVLACVAGTPEAREALKNAEIPQTEAVKPGPAPDLRATYDGEPQFTPIPDSPVQYAVNSPSPIFNVDRRYYWCEDGIWYDADYAVGPWAVCSYVPRPIYLIPPSCPFYYVTYCRIFSVSPSSICYGYYPGYRGCYAWGPTIVYGTGWRYRWWVGSSCYVRPVTWGVGVRWSSSACSWTFGLGWGSSCAWGGVSTYRRAPSIAVGVGGGTNVRYVSGYRNSIGVDAAVPVVRHSRPDNLYVRQPTRIVRPVPPVQDPPQTPYRRPTVKDPGRRDPPTAPTPGGNATRPRDPDGTPSRGHDVLRPNDPDRDDTPRVPRRPDRKDPDVDPRDNSKTPRPNDADRDHGPKNPRRDDVDRDPPKPRTPRDTNRDDDNRVPRREPPPPPPPVERREPPRNPPPPVERREPPPPRTPPPPPPPVERREPPRSPPPEHREPPRNPPPQQEHRRDSDRSSDRGSDRRK